MIVNNTFWGSRPNDAHLTPQGNELLGVGVYNNIFVDGHKVVYTWSGANPGKQDIRFGRNLYAGYTLFAELEDSYGRQTFAQWQSRFKLDSNSLDGVDPRFVDAVNGDYRLQPDSPARTLGRDVLNLTGRGTDAVIPAGAYISGEEVIGVAETPNSRKSRSTPAVGDR